MIKRPSSICPSISDNRPLRNPKEWDIVVNYHISQILKLRKELLQALREE